MIAVSHFGKITSVTLFAVLKRLLLIQFDQGTLNSNGYYNKSLIGYMDKTKA